MHRGNSRWCCAVFRSPYAFHRKHHVLHQCSIASNTSEQPHLERVRAAVVRLSYSTADGLYLRRGPKTALVRRSTSVTMLAFVAVIAPPYFINILYFALRQVKDIISGCSLFRNVKKIAATKCLLNSFAVPSYREDSSSKFLLTSARSGYVVPAQCVPQTPVAVRSVRPCGLPSPMGAQQSSAFCVIVLI